MNFDFAKQMRLSGKKYNFVKVVASTDQESDKEGANDSHPAEEESDTNLESDK